MYTFLYVSAENKVFLTFKDQISPHDYAGFFKVFIF